MKMNKLAFTRRFTFAVLSLLITANLWGQAALRGSGTSSDPYLITSAEDWNIFANTVNSGNSYSGKNLKLTMDITLTIQNGDSDKMVGVITKSNNKPVEDKWFSGTFDGDWHTITFNVGTEETAYNPDNEFAPSAPFRVIDGATINNLTVIGKIYPSNKYNAGLVGYNYNEKTSNDSYINNCTSGIIVDCSKITNDDNPDCSSAGFLAENKKGGVYFTNCIFNGKIDKGGKDHAQKGAGFVSYNGTRINFTNCTMAGVITLTSNISTYWRNGNASFTNAYYVNNYGGVDNCTQATTTAPTDGIARKHIVDGESYYVPGAEVTGFDIKTYSYIEGETITIDAPIVSYYGRTLTRGTDYVIKKKYGAGDYALVDGDITLSDAGDYDIKIEGKDGSNYGGSQTTTIKVVEFNTWAVLKEYLADASKGDRVITLSSDITSPNPKSDSALVVKGKVILNLNNKTINRNLTDTVIYGQVIRVKKGANLTINGPGNIKGGYSWTGPYNSILDDDTEYYDKRDAGGIHNMGDLVLNNVTIDHNKCVKEAEGSESYSARGGGIYSGNGSSLRIYDSRIYGNEAKGGGGGVYSAGANPFVMEGVHINGNESESKGGGVRVKTTGDKIAYLTDCTINANFVEANVAQGAGIFMEGGTLAMTRCDITSNQADHQGCGFYSSQGTTTAKDCNIYNNGTYHEDGKSIGAGIYLNNGSTYIMDGGTIEGNNCVNDGGGIYVANGAVCQVKGNVKIRDNYKASIGSGATDNNAYLAGTSVIKVVGELGEDAIIHITPSSNNRCYVEVAEGVSSADVISHLKVDDIEYDMIIDSDNNIVVYKSYSWKETTTWDGTIAENSSGAGTIPTADSDLTINRTLTIPKGCTAYAKSITMGKYVHIYIEDGGELITSNDNVDVSVRKDIVKGTSAGKGWYLISSSVNGAIIDEKTNLITIDYENYNTYDLYRFNEAAELQWENYRAGHADFKTLQNGRGYLYRNKSAYTVIIDGTLNVSDVTYTLSCIGSELTGFNIIGNPYSHNVYKGAEGSAIPNGDLLEDNYYMLNPTTGKWDLTDDGTVIPPLTGILVQATKTGTLTMTNSTSVASGSKDVEKKSDNIWFTISNNDYEDRACVVFKEGHGLNKIEHLNEEAPMLYIRHNGEDFASVDMNPEAKMFNLNFEAKTMGYYTLSVKPQGDYRYLHLIDKVTEKEIDLLEEQEYTFIGSTSDAADRFIVRLDISENPEESDNEVFAYQSGDEIVVTGEGELQVFDVMGRFVATYNVSGVQTVTKPITAGVYIVKLNEKTQKIIIK